MPIREYDMKSFMSDTVFLKGETAEKLYFGMAKDMPICDYHCHLSAKEIYENKAPESLTELWLKTDHYKWRIMRASGIEEKYITGDGDDRQKLVCFGKALSLCPGNPLYAWAHIELKKYFGIDTPVSEKTAGEIYDKTKIMMRDGDFRPRTLIENSGVKYICTTDDPADSLMYHELLKSEKSFGCRVLPTFRPDRALSIEKADFAAYVKKLGEAAKTDVSCLDGLIKALYIRAEDFARAGCRVSDQSMGRLAFSQVSPKECDGIYKKALTGEKISRQEEEKYKTFVFSKLCEKYYSLGFATEIHIGALRNNNSRLFESVGADSGCDCTDDGEIMIKLNRLLDSLNKKGCLGKAVLFNLNPKDSLPLAVTCGNFQGDGVFGKMQYGPAWWFLDTESGIKSQLVTLSETGAIGTFIGMETDSRSFTSYGRHDYFRRILCSVLGEWIDDGKLFFDEAAVRELIERICYKNAVEYFNFE